MFKNVFRTGGQRVDRQRREQKLNETAGYGGKLQKIARCNMACWEIEGAGGSLKDKTEYCGEEQKRREQLEQRQKKRKGSDLEEADRERENDSAEGRWTAILRGALIMRWGH